MGRALGHLNPQNLIFLQDWMGGGGGGETRLRLGDNQFLLVSTQLQLLLSVGFSAWAEVT
jgi:hypothetical protein